MTQNLTESKDNVKYVYAIEEYCHPLYLNDPVSRYLYVSTYMDTCAYIHAFIHRCKHKYIHTFKESERGGEKDADREK